MNEKIRGRGRIGPNRWFGYRLGWPLASLSVAPDSITFSMWPVTYRFERSSIQFLLKRHFLGWASLFIVHRNPEFAKFVVFQPLEFSHLESLLTQNGYQVTESEADLPAEGIRFSTAIPLIGYIAAMTGLVIGVVAAAIAIGVAVGLIGKR